MKEKITMKNFLTNYIGLQESDATKLSQLTHKQLKFFALPGVKAIPFEIAETLGRDGSALWVIDNKKNVATYENPYKKIEKINYVTMFDIEKEEVNSYGKYKRKRKTEHPKS